MITNPTYMTAMERTKMRIDVYLNQGREEGIIQTATNMFNEGSSLEFISKVTGLSIEFLSKLLLIKAN